MLINIYWLIVLYIEFLLATTDRFAIVGTTLPVCAHNLFKKLILLLACANSLALCSIM